jgi:hypothetical protein
MGATAMKSKGDDVAMVGLQLLMCIGPHPRRVSHRQSEWWRRGHHLAFHVNKHCVEKHIDSFVGFV